MTIWKVTIGARKAGAIGTMYCEKRTYIIGRDGQYSRDDVNEIAIKRAYDEGLEHVCVESARLQDDEPRDTGRFEDSPRYRADMIDAGRGRLVR